MALTTRIKELTNSMLNLFNMHVDSLTQERQELERLQRLAEIGHFDRPVFSVPDAIRESKFERILDALPRYHDRIQRLQDPSKNDVGFSLSNPFFGSPDADVLYCCMSEFQPAKVIEIGCGNSTRVVRQAIIDGSLDTFVVSIDPAPRREIEGFSDQVIREPIELRDRAELFESLESNDVVFIDSSHKMMIGNDVSYLFLNILPQLRQGVLVHVHDVFLPFDYPRDWILDETDRRAWNEQHLLQAILTFGSAFEVIWPGHYVQRCLSDQLPSSFSTNGRATSFWMRKL